MDWECGDFNGGLAADTRACHWLVPPSELRDGYTDPTLMATMAWGRFAGTPNSAGDIAAFGIIVVSAFDDADPVGDACPGPITDCNADWIYLHYVPYVPFAGSLVVSGPDVSELDRRSSARRRLGNDKGILLVAENVGIAVDFHWHVRCLIKE